jgi:hypothetical protein
VQILCEPKLKELIVPENLISLIWLKPFNHFIYPSHKWEGNDQAKSKVFIAVGFRQQDKVNQ